MIRKFKDFIWLLLRKMNLGGAVQLMLKSALLDDGWFKSFNEKRSIDKNGNPIPWNTYPFIKFIEPRLKNTFRIFEYGSGNSTIWYSKRVESIVAVENDKNWFEIVKTGLPENANIIYRDLSYSGDYCREVLNQKEQFHIIIIDGRDRVNSVKNSLEKLTSGGVIILDNSELVQYTEAMEFMQKKGFKRIDFSGISPITAHNTSTSIFYRSENCLGI